MRKGRTTPSDSDDDQSDKILAALAKQHPSRPTKRNFVDQFRSAAEPDMREAVGNNVAKRIGKLISSGAIEERLSVNDSSDRIGLSGRALVAISLNIEVLRLLKKDHNDVIEQIWCETVSWRKNLRSDGHLVPPIVIRDILMVYGSDHFDLLVTILHSKEVVAVDGYSHKEEIIYQYVREVIHNKVIGVNGTRTMGIASSRSYPML